ncbi:GNAT family N-acetyltransferase [Fulvivirgaceae bacterium BMA12]|uniref:GNAT family N-acetyltransferase n=1 Tax=Agaribacillus aureus TaxID=3051825 RepID=A0ABT8L9P4_9BACT|nr:GNAT family N-acetyltransferase [Fulvivirgaceae bacterium BMA12]
MILAKETDLAQVVKLITRSFDKNKSVNYVVKQDKKRIRRIERLAEYAFRVCYAFGEVWMSEDKNACALFLFSEKKRLTLNAIWWDLKLAFGTIGISRVSKVLTREGKVKKQHPQNTHYCYLWFIGVDPNHQKKGLGSQLLRQLIDKCRQWQRPIYLETSVSSNLKWYKSLGFEQYRTIQFDYELFLLRKNDPVT